MSEDEIARLRAENEELRAQLTAIKDVLKTVGEWQRRAAERRRTPPLRQVPKGYAHAR